MMTTEELTYSRFSPEMSPEMDMALTRRSGRLSTRQLPTAELLQDGVDAVLQAA